MKLLDERLLELLDKRGICGDLQTFLYPKLDDMLNPFDLNGMQAACDKIKAAINQGKQILIFGDYDCDGISAASILVLHLRKLGGNVSAFIPSRFEDGYGLSSDTIDELCQNNKPDLVVTVDLGITAVAEVELLKQQNVDVIVTDHHEPLDTLPDCIVIDAKVAGQKYAFNGLCGAGVALKLVEALSGRQAIKEYLDLCAIATIGDIVPLVSENRVIAKLGLEKINSDSVMPSVKFMLNTLSLQALTAEDVSFRLVPRLNACGRMDNGKKVLDFLIETDETKLMQLYAELEKDNAKRLQEITSGNEAINLSLQDIDLNTAPAILVAGEFHQGVLGILASRVCHDYNRPAIIFTKTAEGTLKGSGRSLEHINIHGILSELSHLFIRFGGHKMAIGVELKEENFEEFKKQFLQKLSAKTSIDDFAVADEYDIEIAEEDINPKFVGQLEMLAPFGCGNERPVFGIKVNGLVCEQMRGKSFKHYRLHTTSGKQIIAFNSHSLIELLKSNCQKLLLVDLELSEYKGKKYTTCKLKSCKYLNGAVSFSNKIAEASALLNKYISLHNKNSNLSCTHLAEQKLLEQAQELSVSNFGTVIVCQSQKTLEKLQQNSIIANNYKVCCKLPTNKQNCILISSRGLWQAQVGYNNYIYFRSQIKNEHYLFDQAKVVYDCSLFNQKQFVDTSREAMSHCYNTIIASAPELNCNDIFELAEKLSYISRQASVQQMMFALLVFAELGFITISDYSEPVVIVQENTTKHPLTQSKFYNAIAQNNN